MVTFKSVYAIMLQLVLLFGSLPSGDGLEVPSRIYVGGIFPRLTTDYEKAFLFAIEEVNRNSSILPGTMLKPLTNKTDAYDTFDNIRTVQYLLKKGVVAIIGPMTSTAVKYTQPYCAGFHVPQLAPVATDPTFTFSPANFPFLVRLSPSDSLQCQALAGLIDFYNWTHLALLTSKDDYGINGLLALKDIANQKSWKIRANEHFAPIVNYSALDVKLQLRAIQNSKVRLVVLNTSSRYTVAILKQAEGMGMLKKWIWIVTDGSTNADWSTIPGDFPIHEYTGVIGTRPALGQGSLYPDFMKKWVSRGHARISTTGGKIYDGVLALASALDAMLKDGHNVSGTEMDFDFKNEAQVTPWQPGSKLLDYVKKVKIDGIMSNIGFNAIGSPLFVEYDIVNYGRNGFVKVGKWSKQDGLKMDPKTRVYWLSGSTAVPSDIANSVQNTTLKIVTVLEYPFVFLKTLPDGSQEFDGFCVDLLKKLKYMLKFDYTIELEKNGIYGAQDIYSLHWNGLIKILVDGDADLAIGPLSISSQRQGAIDFTQPYMDVGLSILMSKQKDQSYQVFSFLRPFDYKLWLAIVFTALGVGVFLWIHSTFSPYGYHGRCAQASAEKTVPRHVAMAKNYLGFFNSIWSSFAYYVSQGPDVLHPVSPSGRVVVGVWWFAVLIIGATYTANLASFLIVERFSTSIQSIEDLARQTKVHYGIIKATQAQMFFETSSIPTFVTMWEFMKAANSLVENTTVGVERARKGNYAFIYDTVILEYYVKQQPCETLQIVGGEFGNFGYGFGLPKESPFTLQLSISILELRQKEYITTLKQKWLRGQCDYTNPAQGSASALAQNSDVLTFSDMSGVFYCVFISMAVSLVVLISELLFESYKETKEDRKMGMFKASFKRIKLSWTNYMSSLRLSTVKPTVKPSLNPTSHDLSIKSKESCESPQRIDFQTLKIDDLEMCDLTA